MTKTAPKHETVPFIPISIAVMTISDTRTRAQDKSGDLLVARLIAAGHRLGGRCLVRDEFDDITAAVQQFIANEDVHCVLATGGTGLTGRDVTPEAFRSLFDKEIDGFGELFRFLSWQKIGTSSLQSRAVGGMASGTYLFALPGSPSACTDAWDELLVHQLDNRTRPCNLVEIMPRLQETPPV